ncbi:MAG: isopenicillin N synthase family oxygenase [Phenylobacterium sp.]|uniref:isopenicillin N synthase family dioxygenase n=1 Tax=Phenylobacterium sp. TaxID=1871053 RepID=UPI0025F5B004|nr:2-oxoglutarate and iron-dependent oxygenase domain-containing protein [Phenylobacterium sp.]MBI1198678.1 isopenicillin N synthase family oxygenase [Phenylobacterium sp.]
MSELPILDLGPYLRNEPGALEKLSGELYEAATKVGFYFIINHGVSQELIDRTFAESARFHALPEEEKLKIKQSEHYVGYVPRNGMRIDTGDGFNNSKNRADVQSAYHVGRDYSPDHPLAKAGVRYYVPQPWPENLPGFKENVQEYFKACESLGNRLLKIYAAALDVPEDYFDEAFKDPLDYLRMVHYPRTDKLSSDQFGLGAHTDAGFMTFLPQTKVPGLEIMLADGRWIPQPTIPGAYLVNAGQALKRWTNDRFRATPHRVISPTGVEDRHSLAFFYNPGVNAHIECITEKPKHEPMKYGDHMAQYMANTYRY